MLSFLQHAVGCEMPAPRSVAGSDAEWEYWEEGLLGAVLEAEHHITRCPALWNIRAVAETPSAGIAFSCCYVGSRI